MNANPGWYPDPAGRYPQRWYDGAGWTDSVLAANGQPVNDPLTRVPPSTTALPVLAQPAWGGAPGWQPQLSAPVMASTTVRAIAGGVAFVGAVLAALCLFVLDWVDGGMFLDIRDGLADVDVDLLSLDGLAKAYAMWLGFVVLGIAIATSITAIVRAGGRTGIVAGAVVAAIGALLHTFFVVRLFRGPGDPEFVAWLATIGYLVLSAALIVRSRAS